MLLIHGLTCFVMSGTFPAFDLVDQLAAAPLLEEVRRVDDWSATGSWS